MEKSNNEFSKYNIDIYINYLIKSFNCLIFEYNIGYISQKYWIYDFGEKNWIYDKSYYS